MPRSVQVRTVTVIFYRRQLASFITASVVVRACQAAVTLHRGLHLQPNGSNQAFTSRHTAAILVSLKQINFDFFCLGHQFNMTASSFVFKDSMEYLKTLCYTCSHR